MMIKRELRSPVIVQMNKNREFFKEYDKDIVGKNVFVNNPFEAQSYFLSQIKSIEPIKGCKFVKAIEHNDGYEIIEDLSNEYEQYFDQEFQCKCQHLIDYEFTKEIKEAFNTNILPNKYRRLRKKLIDVIENWLKEETLVENYALYLQESVGD